MERYLEIVRFKFQQYKNIIENFSYLSLLQVINLLLPLITYPYLIRTLGKETYGLIIFSQAIVSYFVILVNFGFNFIATKEISVHRGNKDKLSEIVSSVIIIKGALLLVSLLVLSGLLPFIRQVKGYEVLVYLTLWMCLYDFIFPLWYFQGIEKMKYITLITLISRMIFLGLIFVFIHTTDDYLFVPIINGVGAISGGVVAFYIVFGLHKIKFKLQNINVIKFYFLNAFPIFLSNLSTTLYLTTNKVVVGFFLGMEEVAIFDLAEKISTLFKTPIQIIGQAIYPHVAKNKSKLFLRKCFKYTIALACVILFVGNVLREFVVTLLGGAEMLMSSVIFPIILVSIIPVTISLFYANITLTSWGYNKEYLKVRLYTNVVYFISLLVLYLSNNLRLRELATLCVFVEIVAAFFAFYYCNKKNINFLYQEKESSI